MSIKYGLISRVDANVLEKTIDLLLSDTTNSYWLNITEVGCYGGDTGEGICEYIKLKGRNYWIIGIDNNKDGELVRFQYNKMIHGNSHEVYNELKDESQDLIFIDALHTKIAVIGDFFAYAPKVKVGGYLAFHDTGKHLDPLSGWQGVGDKNDPDFCLGGVRKGLEAIGLFPAYKEYPQKSGVLIKTNVTFPGWELIFDEADPQDSGGGVAVFKRIF